MISERTFADVCGSFWHSIMPRSEQAVRMMNASRDQVVATYAKRVSAANRGLINESATRIAHCALKTRRPISKLTQTDIADSIASAYDFIHCKRALAVEQHANLNSREIAECRDLAVRLIEQLEQYKATLTMFVPVPGVGIVDSCEADGVSGRTLIEVKAGNRLCRSRDIRQSLTYVALMYVATTRRNIDELCIVNPRVGWRVTIGVDEVLEMSGGKSFDYFVAEFVNYVTEHCAPMWSRE